MVTEHSGGGASGVEKGSLGKSPSQSTDVWQEWQWQFAYGRGGLVCGPFFGHSLRAILLLRVRRGVQSSNLYFTALCSVISEHAMHGCCHT
jgi:hypothetical protein